MLSEREQPISFALDEVLKAHQYRLEHIDDFPVSQNLEILERRQEGDVLHMRRMIDLGKDYPEVIRSVTPKELLIVAEELTFDRKAGIETFCIFPKDKKDKFKIQGDLRYEAKGDSSSVRHYQFRVSIDYLILAPFKAQFEKIYRTGLNDYLDEVIKLLESGKY